MELKLLPREIDLKLKGLVGSERKITAEIIGVISEIDRRRLFLEMGFSSLFAYLTQEIGYSPSAAQRRIEAARISRQVPGVTEKLQTGAINLSSLAMTAQAIRETENLKTCKISSEIKTDLISMIENKNTKETQVILAKTLNLPVVNAEKARHQRDESVRLELTLSKSQNEKLQKAKEVASNTLLNPNIAELIEYLANFYLQKKGTHETLGSGKLVAKRTSESEVPRSENGSRSNRYIPQMLRRKIFQRDQFCQWRNNETNKVCGSKHQLEIHHQKPVWAGGDETAENLQLLCRAHNAHTYKKEANIKIL